MRTIAYDRTYPAMTTPWDLGPIDPLPIGTPCLLKGPGGERLACVRSEDGSVDVVWDLCPHEGYPLSQGVVKDGILTCKWHNWKFDLKTGDCTFGGEGVRRLPSSIDERRHLLVVGDVDEATERARISASLRAGLREGDVSRSARDAMRLAALSGERGLAAAFEVILGDALSRERYGLDHPEASGIDVWTWVARGWLPPEPSVVLALTLAGEPLRFLPARERAAPVETVWDDARRVSAALEAEERAEAEGRARHLARLDAERTLTQALLPFVRRALYDYGHGAIYAGKAVEIFRAFPDLGEAALAALTVSLGWATVETALPEWSATREGIARGTMIDKVGTTPFDAVARAAFEEEVLRGEKEAVHATLESIARGIDVADVLVAIGHAAAIRLGRFDLEWTRKDDAAIGFLEVTHAVTCARAMQELWPMDPRPENLSLAVIAASFVGKLRKADDPDAPPPDAFVGDARASRLVDAVRAHEPARARAMVSRMGRATRLEAYRALAPYAAFEAAVRPILLAHTVKVTEAMYRMEIDDPREKGAYLDALVRFLATVVPERAFSRTATIARKFLTDGRPPKGLY
jgi:nitrite reductase/ring-hydroxylating ferredoxin subunit